MSEATWGVEIEGDEHAEMAVAEVVQGEARASRSSRRVEVHGSLARECRIEAAFHQCWWDVDRGHRLSHKGARTDVPAQQLAVLDAREISAGARVGALSGTSWPVGSGDLTPRIRS